MTTHSLVENDCRDLSFIPSASVHLIITHPPPFGSFGGSSAPSRFPAIRDHGDYLAQLDAVWGECERVLAPGGHLACVVSPLARRDEDLPLTADVHSRTRELGLEATHSIRWLASDRVELDDSAFYGAPNQPCGGLLSDSQDVLVMRKPGQKLVSVETQAASRMPADYFAICSSPVWLIPAASDPRHPQSFPVELAERLIRMFSHAGDTVLDPFAGIGTTSAAAREWGRNSIAVEAEQRYFDSMADRLTSVEWRGGEISVTRGPFAREALPSAPASLVV